ncbi:MAG: cellulase family glycosylhydrolase [Clostridia bacterium]|nr:cellulase family glycosylhydrolase [Clostridia bacterium]
MPEGWQEQLNQTITHAEFCGLVHTLVERLKPELLPLWEETSAMASASHTPMGRDDGAVGLFYASQALDTCAITSFNHPAEVKILSHQGSWAFDQHFPLWPNLAPGYQLHILEHRNPENTEGYHSPSQNLMDAAFWFVILRVSPVNDMQLMSYSSDYSLRMADPLTRREALVYLWRLVEGTPNLLEGNHYLDVREIGGYDKSIITDALLNAPTDLPEPTHSQLPATWKGTGISKYKDANIYCEFREGDIAFLEENGFNCTRLFFSFPSLRYPDYPQDTYLVNETEFRDLDQLLAWCIKHGVHLQIAMDATPNDYRNFEHMEEAEWDVMTAYWEAFLRRYKGIPNRYLTFDLANERMPSFNDEDQIRAVKLLEKMVARLRAADPDRVLLLSFPRNPAPIWMEGVAKAGLSLGCHPYIPEVLCSGPNWGAKKAFVSWPYPFFAQVVRSDEALVMEGDFGGHVLWMQLNESQRIRVTFDNGKSLTKLVNPSDHFIAEIEIPQGVKKLEVTPGDERITFIQIGIMDAKSGVSAAWKNPGCLIPHDLWAGDSTGGSHLLWDSENGFTSDRLCTPEYLYELLIQPQLELAKKYHVGLMVNEMGSYATGDGYDVALKVAYDHDVLQMLEEHQIPWIMCDLSTCLKQYVHGQNPQWMNANWETKTYQYEDGRVNTIIYSTELMDMYRAFTKPEAQSAKPEVESAKPEVENPKPEIETTKPTVETTKPDEGILIRPAQTIIQP